MGTVQEVGGCFGNTSPPNEMLFFLVMKGYLGGAGVAGMVFFFLHYVPLVNIICLPFFSLHPNEHLDPLLGFLGCTWAKEKIKLISFSFPINTHSPFDFFSSPTPTSTQTFFFQFKAVHEPKQSHHFRESLFHYLI
jgi:hypothetical protein